MDDEGLVEEGAGELKKIKAKADVAKVGQEQIHGLLFGDKLSWQAIIYDLINTGQLEPWDIDLSMLSGKYLEKIRELEEANFFISSKVLLAASLLLRLKSEILLNEHIRSIDEVLFGKKEEKYKPMERIILDENEIPILYPKTPMARMRKVSLQELMLALNKAINTENRRIKREINEKQMIREAEIVMPKASRVNIRDRIKKIYSKILTAFKDKKTKISYSELTGNDKEEKRACFLPVLHLDSQQRIFLEQDKHFAEIYVWLYSHYKSQNLPIAKELIQEAREELEASEENPLGGFSDYDSLGIENSELN
jgi:segregation and condensation protein A